MEEKELANAVEELWNTIRVGSVDELMPLFDPEFRLSGFPGPDPQARFLRFHEEAPVGPPEEGDPGMPHDPASQAPATPGTPTPASSHPSMPVPTPEAGIDYLHRFFGEGRGLTNLIPRIDGLQVLGEIGIAQVRWIAEHGLGDAGSPRYVSGRVSLTFRTDDNGECRLAGWLGSRGPHHAVTGSRRSEDVTAIREQILRVFEAYRQKDMTMLRRTHTADWRGFTLSSNSVGRGIDAYMRAAEGAASAAQFEEYSILDLDAIFYGDLAIVPYVARIAGKSRTGQTQAYRLRVLDVYLRDPIGWNQVATNTSLHPEERL